MKWVTRQCLHFDRAAAAWLIRRFVDADAAFIFVKFDAGPEALDGATPFCMPGVELGSRDVAGTTFHKVMVKHRITDPAILAIDQIVDRGVNYVAHGYRPDAADRYGQIAVGLLELSHGLLLLESDDADNLERSLFTWDAVYRTLRAEHLVETQGLALPPIAGVDPGVRIAFQRELLRRDRDSATTRTGR